MQVPLPYQFGIGISLNFSLARQNFPCVNIFIYKASTYEVVHAFVQAFRIPLLTVKRNRPVVVEKIYRNSIWQILFGGFRLFLGNGSHSKGRR